MDEIKASPNPLNKIQAATQRVESVVNFVSGKGGVTGGKYMNSKYLLPHTKQSFYDGEAMRNMQKGKMNILREKMKPNLSGVKTAGDLSRLKATLNPNMERMKQSVVPRTQSTSTVGNRLSPLPTGMRRYRLF